MQKPLLIRLAISVLITLFSFGNQLIASDRSPELPRAFAYLTAAFEFSQDYESATKTYKPFVPFANPTDFLDLINGFDAYPEHGNGFYNWLRKRDQTWQAYKDARDKRDRTKKRFEDADQLAQADQNPSNLQSSWLWGSTPSGTLRDEAEETAKTALETFEQVRRKFIGPQGCYRTLSELESERLIYNSVFHPRKKFKTKKQHPYKTPPQQLTGAHRVKGFILPPWELKIALSVLERLTKSVEREIFALQQVLLFYERDIVSKCSGWTLEQLSNWNNLYTLIESVQGEIDESVRRKFDKSYPDLPTLNRFPRDLSSDRGRILAQLNRDALGQYLFLFWRNIKKIHLGDLTTLDDYQRNRKQQHPSSENKEVTETNDTQENPISTFERVYNGCDLLEEAPYTDTDTFKNPLLDKTKHRQASNPYIFVLMNVIQKRLRPGIPTDGAMYAEFEDFPKLPKGTSMATEFRSFKSMDFHRAYYPAVLKKLLECFTFRKKQSSSSSTFLSGSFPQIGKKPKKWTFVEPEPDFNPNQIKEILAGIRSSPYNSEAVTEWKYDPSDLKEYSEYFISYRQLLEKQRGLHLKLHVQPTYFWVKSYIPEPWKLFFFNTEPVEKNTSENKEIDLSNAGLKDSDLKIPNQPSDKPLRKPLNPYTTVNLSNNESLFGDADYGLSVLLRQLDLSHCNLHSLKCIHCLQLLDTLDISHNQLKLSKEHQDIFLNMRLLTSLNISNNELINVDSLIVLFALTSLDVSGNKIQSLAPLSNPHLKTLIASKNPLKGSWRLSLPPLLPALETFDLSEHGKDFQYSSAPAEFKDRYPKLLSLKLGDEPEIKWFSEEVELHLDPVLETEHPQSEKIGLEVSLAIKTSEDETL